MAGCAAGSSGKFRNVCLSKQGNGFPGGGIPCHCASEHVSRRRVFPESPQCCLPLAGIFCGLQSSFLGYGFASVLPGAGACMREDAPGVDVASVPKNFGRIFTGSADAFVIRRVETWRVLNGMTKFTGSHWKTVNFVFFLPSIRMKFNRKIFRRTNNRIF